jgi:hypothetical protein
VSPAWTTIRGTAEVYENAELLDHGRLVYQRRLGSVPRPGQQIPQPASKGRTRKLLVSAMRSPWCLGIHDPKPEGLSPVRALHTEVTWIARWADGTLRIGDRKEMSLGAYGIPSLLLPPSNLGLAVLTSLPSMRTHEVAASDIESTLMLAAPELVVLGADFYRTRLFAPRGVVQLWEGVIGRQPAMRITIRDIVWDDEIIFQV